jgi:hypothetical protein
MMSEKKKFFGKYRGTVVDNVDPQLMGRIMAIVPDVSALLPTSWALPCVPVATLQGGVFVIPAIGDGVWIEFEHGDPDYPIWVGGFWSTGATPPLAALANPALPPIILSTIGESAVVVSDSPIPPMIGPGVMLMGGPASFITVSADGIQIFAPQIEINGIMIVNEGALTVSL